MTNHGDYSKFSHDSERIIDELAMLLASKDAIIHELSYEINIGDDQEKILNEKVQRCKRLISKYEEELEFQKTTNKKISKELEISKCSNKLLTEINEELKKHNQMLSEKIRSSE